MHETTAERAAEAAASTVSRADDGPSANGFPLLPGLVQQRLAKGLKARSQKVSNLLTSPPVFGVLMAGSSVSMFGSRISTVAFPMLVLHIEDSPFITGLVAFAIIAPSMLVYVPAGVLVDRWNPRRVMLVSELLRGLVIASVVLSLAICRLQVSLWFLIPAMIVEEILEIFFTLADRRYLSRLMERDNIASRQASVEVRSHAAVLAGRPLGPFLFALKPLYPFLVDAVSFLFSAGSLFVLRRSNEPVKKSHRVRLSLKEMVADIGQGVRWLKKDRQASLAITLMAVTSLVAQALILMFLSEAHERELSTADIGIVLAASGVGGVLGTIISRRLPDSLKNIRKFWLPIQMVAWGGALAILEISGGLSVLCCTIAMLILGLTGAMGNIESRTYFVSHVADDMIAKITGIDQMVMIGATALGPVLGGAAIQRYGPQGAIKCLLLIVVLLVFGSLLTPEVTGKMGEIYQSAASVRPLRSMATDPGGQERNNLPAEACAAAGSRQGPALNAEGALIWDDSAVSS
jgi:MFS family permease